MLLPNTKPLHHLQQNNKCETMNTENRRLKEIQTEKQLFKSLLEEADTISDCLAYKGKLDILTKEEKEILKRNDVII